MLTEISRLPWQRLVKFVIIGGIAFGLDFGLYFLLTRLGHFPYLASRAVSITGSMVWNFTLNRYWTFQATAGQVSRQATRFLIVMVATSLLNLALMRLGVSIWHLNDLVVLIVVSVLIMLVNFIAHHWWSYAER